MTASFVANFAPEIDRAERLRLGRCVGEWRMPVLLPPGQPEQHHMATAMSVLLACPGTAALAFTCTLPSSFRLQDRQEQARVPGHSLLSSHSASGGASHVIRSKDVQSCLLAFQDAQPGYTTLPLPCGCYRADSLVELGRPMCRHYIVGSS